MTAKQKLTELAAKHNDPELLHQADQLHQLRIDLKNIRYTAELGTQSAEAKGFAKEVEAAQDAIGAWHDWLMLTETAGKTIGKFPSSAFFIQLRSLTISSFATAVRSAQDILRRHGAAARKLPQSIRAAGQVSRTA